MLRPKVYKVRTSFVSSSGDYLSKIGHDFSNKVVQKLKLSINHFYKKCAHKQLFFNEKKNHKEFTLKVQNWHFLTNCHRMETQNLVISFDYS